MEKQFFCTQFHAYLIASLFAIPRKEMAQAEAIFAHNFTERNSDWKP